MDPTVAAPMTFASPEFAIIMTLFALVAGTGYMIFAAIAKARAEMGAVYDPAQTLTTSIMAMVWLLTLFIGAIIGVQIWKAGNATTESWAALTFMMGWVTAKAGDIFSNRFGSNKQSADQAATIAQQARTSAVMQDALLDPAVVVTNTGSGGRPLARATMGSGDGAPSAGAPLKAESVIVEAEQAVVTESRDPKAP